jgi:hypothetical protein
MQWLDTEQSDFDKSYFEGEARDARERWLRMVEWEKRDEKGGVEGNAPSSGDENMKRPSPVKPTQRGRGRGLAGPRQVGRMPSGRGNTPVVLSRPRVLAGLYQIMSDFMTSSTRVLGLYH